MGDTLKRFLANKNTVTLIAIIVMVVVLYLFYNWRVKQAVSTTTVCYAAETIPARTLITDDMVSERTVLSEDKANKHGENTFNISPSANSSNDFIEVLRTVLVELTIMELKSAVE